MLDTRKNPSDVDPFGLGIIISLDIEARIAARVLYVWIREYVFAHGGEPQPELGKARGASVDSVEVCGCYVALPWVVARA